MGLLEAQQHLLKARTDEKATQGAHKSEPKPGMNVTGHTDNPSSPLPRQSGASCAVKQSCQWSLEFKILSLQVTWKL